MASSRGLAVSGARPAGVGAAVAISIGFHLTLAGSVLAFTYFNRSAPTLPIGAAAALEVSLAPPAFQRPAPDPAPDKPKPLPDPPKVEPDPVPDPPKRINVPDAITLPPQQPPRPPAETKPPPPPQPAPVSTAQRPVAAAATVGDVTAGARAARQNWEGKVLARLEQKKRYPPAARRDGLEDVVYVRITLDRKGGIISSTIVRSKGIAILDDAVSDLVRRANPLPALPETIDGDQYTITVPVDFFVKK